MMGFAGDPLRRAWSTALGVWLAGVLGIALGGTARADVSEGFHWVAPAECPQREAVLAQLENVLGEAQGADRATLGSARVNGAVRREGGVWELSIDVQDEKGQRTRHLRAERCDDLAHAAALAVALLLEQAADAATEEPAASVPAQTAVVNALAADAAPAPPTGANEAQRIALGQVRFTPEAP